MLYVSSSSEAHEVVCHRPSLLRTRARLGALGHHLAPLPALAAAPPTLMARPPYGQDGAAVANNNVIVFFTDQQRFDTSSLHGNPMNLTKNFDRMALRGTHIMEAVTCQPVCGPGAVEVINPIERILFCKSQVQRFVRRACSSICVSNRTLANNLWLFPQQHRPA